MLASLVSESEDTKLMLVKDLTTVNCLEQTAAENKGPARRLRGSSRDP